MNSVLDGAFQNFQISDDLAREHELLREAETHVCDEHPKGYFKFIRLKLNNRNLGTDRIHRFKFVWTVEVFYTTKGMTGASTSEFAERQGCLTFRYDPMLRAHAAYMFDDHKTALYAEKGQNRDFLASHIETGEFIIEDEDVLEDIQARLEVLKANQKPIVPADTELMSKEQVAQITEEGLDDEEKRLEETLRLIKDRKAKRSIVESSNKSEKEVKAQPKAESRAPKRGRPVRPARVPLVTA